MDFWIVSALLTFIAILIVMLPLTRKTVAPAAQGEQDHSVYLQQLKEVEADLARGLLDETSAEQARLEISRRILLNDRHQHAGANNAQQAPDQSDLAAQTTQHYLFSAPSRLAFIAVLVMIPAISWGIYAMTGTPDLPSQPLAERKAHMVQDKSAVELIAQAEAHLAQAPQDGRGWAILAPIYLRLNRVDDAINAYQQALQLLGDDAERLIGLGEAMVIKSGGQISAEALAQFEKAGKLEPADLRPPLMRVRALMQQGKREPAIAELQKLLATAPENAPWRADIMQTIANLQAGAAGNTSGNMTGNTTGNAAAQSAQSPQPQLSVPGPTAADIEAAAQLDEQGRKDMIRSMVDGLAAKLEQNPADLAGWERLLRAYNVLGERDSAQQALRKAASSLPEPDLRQLAQTAAQLGLDVSGVLK